MRSQIDPRVSPGAGEDVSAADRRLSMYQYEQLARVERAQIIGEMLADGLVWCIRLPRRLHAAVRKLIAARRGIAAAASPAAE